MMQDMPHKMMLITPNMTNQRYIFAAISLLSVGSVLVALISQHLFGMAPCAWCVFQRVIYLAIGLVSGLAAWQAPTRTIAARVYAAMTVLLAMAGVASAIYQKNVAAKMFSCDQTLADRWMTQSGLESAVPWLFGIYASCMDAVVYLVGIEYATWSALLFGAIALLGIYLVIAPRPGQG